MDDELEAAENNYLQTRAVWDKYFDDLLSSELRLRELRRQRQPPLVNEPLRLGPWTVRDVSCSVFFAFLVTMLITLSVEPLPMRYAMFATSAAVCISVLFIETICAICAYLRA